MSSPLQRPWAQRPLHGRGDWRRGPRAHWDSRFINDLESKLLLGEWLPNTKVTLRTLALSLNTSMQPVREAVGRLVAASALEATPNRAFRVPELDRAAADEIWSLRFLLEGEAAARFAARRDPKACERFTAATDACRVIDYGRDLRATMRGHRGVERQHHPGCRFTIALRHGRAALSALFAVSGLGARRAGRA